MAPRPRCSRSSRTTVSSRTRSRWRRIFTPELPVSLAVGGVDTSVTVTGEATVLEAARSQIAGTVSQAEVRNLPLNGRNFLDLALLIPGVSPTNVGSTQLFPETSAVPGVSLSVGSQRNLSNNFIVDGLSANDDAAGAERDLVRRRRGRAVSGGHLRRTGRAGARARRLRQRRHQERHERRCTATLYGYFRDERFNAANALSGTKLPMAPGAVRGESRRARSSRTGRSTSRTSSSAALDQIRPRRRSRRTTSAPSTPRLAAVGYQGPPIATGVYPNPGRHRRTSWPRSITSSADRDQFSVRYSLYDVDCQNSRGAGALNAPSASAGPGQHRSDDRGQQHADALGADRARDARAVRLQRPEGAADRSRSGRPSASRASPRSARSRRVRPGA